MGRLIATIWKELLLLSRDKSGLLVLFVMPAVLVLVITLVQDNTMKSIGESDTDILFVDQDGDRVGRRIEKALAEADGVRLIKDLDGKRPNKQLAVQSIVRGDYQLCLVVPEGSTATVKANARHAAYQALSADSGDAPPAPPAIDVEVYFDPTVMGGFRSAVNHLLQLVLVQIEVEEKMNQLAALLPEYVKKTVEKTLGPMAGAMDTSQLLSEPVDLQWHPDTRIKVRALSAVGNSFKKTPNAVQQNVPAWSLFGIFFIVLPMAGSFIKERLWGVQHRLMSFPVSYLTIVSGKVLAYTLVCLVQCGVILFIGKTVLPGLGTPPFEVGPSVMAALLVALSAILAATGYGILLGTAAKTYEQVSMFGPISIVVAAALGGIMVPVYAMPAFMQKITVVSPLAWAQDAFLELFVRGGTLSNVTCQIGLLLIFAFSCVAAAWFIFFRRTYRGSR